MGTLRNGILAIGMLLVVCTQQPNQPDWNNPFDKTGTDYYPPVVQAPAEVTVGVNDTLRLSVTGWDSNGTIAKYLWSTDGKSFDTTLDSSHSFVFPSNLAGTRTVSTKVIDNDGLVSSLAGTVIHVAAFAPVVEASGQMTVDVNDTLRLKATALDSDGKIAKFLWSTNGIAFDTTSDSVHLFVFPVNVTGTITVRMKAIDDDGLVSNTASTKVEVLLRAPVVVPVTADTVVSWKDSVSLSVAAIDSNGTIQKYIWKKSSSAVWDTTMTPNWRTSNQNGGYERVTVGAIDDDGAIGFATIGVLFNRRPERIWLDYPYSGFRHIFDEIDFVDTIGTVIAYGLKAIDPDGAYDSLRFNVQVLDTAEQVVRHYENTRDSIWLDSLEPDMHYILRFVAFDRYGDSIESRINFFSQNYFPKGMVFFPRDPLNNINHPFWIDTTEVTCRELRRFNTISVADTGIVAATTTWNWYDLWGLWFSRLNINLQVSIPAGIGMRVPSEYEWIRAYKNPAASGPFYWGEATHQDVVKQYAWYELNAEASVWVYPHAEKDGPQSVARLLPNEYGLYDMSGNVAELVVNRRKKSIDVDAVRYMGGSAYLPASRLAPTSPRQPADNFIGFRKVFGQVYE
jgi:hypothetical protein